MSCITINQELRIMSCNLEDLSEGVKKSFEEQFKGVPIETLTLFYEPVTDAVILNRDNQYCDLYKTIALEYLQIDCDRRAAALEEQPGDTLKETMDLLEHVARRRERLKIENEAKQIMEVLGNQRIEPYAKSFDILRAFRDIDRDNDTEYFSDYNPFVYGYIQGQRAERARRKAVRAD